MVRCAGGNEGPLVTNEGKDVFLQLFWVDGLKHGNASYFYADERVLGLVYAKARADTVGGKLSRREQRKNPCRKARVQRQNLLVSKPNFLLKRLTRPPVSTIFCLPVKKG